MTDRNGRHPIHKLLRGLGDSSRPQLLRGMQEFAEAEIIIPGGPYEGRRFQCSRQPYTALWFSEVDSGHWSRCVATGPTQSGKTMACFVIPLLYHLFELQETVICGLPDMDMVADKWREDILPVIDRSRYRDLLPQAGGGSRGGRVEAIRFRNGVTLKFMSGGGSDKSRAGFTSRVIVITETDGMDVSSATSRESDKITQLEARTRAYGSRRRVYMECTVSTEEGRTWREYQHGTRSAVVLRCPECSAWVSPEREHLIGWQGALNQREARAGASFSCPSCSAAWSEEQRIEANRSCRIVHFGQTIAADGTVSGDGPQTDTLGFRWSAVNNLFVTAGDIGADEWRASRAPDEDNAEREMRQFVWCLPVSPSMTAETSIEATELAGRMVDYPRGVAPSGTLWLTAAIDLGKYLSHWIVIAWMDGATCHVVDYGRIEIATDSLGIEQATMVGLREFRTMIGEGWPVGQGSGERKVPDQVWIDSGYMAPVVYAFCRDAGQRFRPAIGRGVAQQHRQWYHRPKSTGSIVRQIGEGWHLSRIPAEKLSLVEIDSDQWKTWVHARLTTPIDKPGAMSLFRASPHEHLALAKHLTAETKMTEFIAGKGVVVRWERVRRQNHWFDAMYNACAAGNFCGARLTGIGVVKRTQPASLEKWFSQQR